MKHPKFKAGEFGTDLTSQVEKLLCRRPEQPRLPQTVDPGGHVMRRKTAKPNAWPDNLRGLDRLEKGCFELLYKVLNKEGTLLWGSKNRIKGTILVDSYYLFSLGHMGWLLDLAQRMKEQKKGHLLLAADPNLLAAPSFLADLIQILPTRSTVVLLRKTLNFQNTFIPLISKIRSLRRRRSGRKVLQTSGVSLKEGRCSTAELRIRARLRLSKARPQGMARRHVLIHLRQDDFRGWRSPRSGESPNTYNEFFVFLRQLDLNPVFLSSRGSSAPLLATSIPDRLFVRADQQLDLIKDAFMIFGSYSGPTHLGPGYGIPTVNFDLPWPLAWLNHGHDLFLLKGLQDHAGKRIDPSLYYQYRADFNPDVDGELEIQQAGYQLIPNSSREMIFAFIQMLVELESKEKGSRFPFPTPFDSALRKKLLNMGLVSTRMRDLEELRNLHKNSRRIRMRLAKAEPFRFVAESFGITPLPYGQLSWANWAYAL